MFHATVIKTPEWSIGKGDAIDLVGIFNKLLKFNNS